MILTALWALLRGADRVLGTTLKPFDRIMVALLDRPPEGAILDVTSFDELGRFRVYPPIWSDYLCDMMYRRAGALILRLDRCWCG